MTAANPRSTSRNAKSGRSETLWTVTYSTPNFCVTQGSREMCRRGYTTFHHSTLSRKNFWIYFGPSCRRRMSAPVSWHYPGKMRGFSSKSLIGCVSLEQFSNACSFIFGMQRRSELRNWKQNFVTSLSVFLESCVERKDTSPNPTCYPTSSTSLGCLTLPAALLTFDRECSKGRTLP